jgi:hypothetical protein
MPRMKRKDALRAIRAAGYHGDRELGMHLYLKNWISLSAFSREFETGVAMRRSGVPCDCLNCRRRLAESIDRAVSCTCTASVA